MNTLYDCTPTTPLPADSVQKSLEAKFSGGKSNSIPIVPSLEFSKRIAVSTKSVELLWLPYLCVCPPKITGCLREGHSQLWPGVHHGEICISKWSVCSHSDVAE